MSGELTDLAHAVQIVAWAWLLIRYARGWRLEWRPPARRDGDQALDASIRDRQEEGE